MISTLKKAVTFGFGVVSVTREKTKEWIGEHQFMDKGEQERVAFKGAVDGKIQRGLHKFNVPSKAEYTSLEKRIKELENR
jgi:polyhydroxyalkanoate synthesis regulator phasin